MMMIERAFRSLARDSVRRARTTLLVAAIVVAVALVVAVSGTKLKTSNLDLISPDLQPVENFRQFAETFGTPNFLVVVLEGENPDSLGRAVDLLAPRLASLEGVRSVLSRSPQSEAMLSVTGETPYLTSDDGGLYFLFVNPEDPESQAETISPLVEGVRGVLDAAGLAEQGVAGGLTGLPVYAIDDRDVVRSDISRLSLISFALILVLFGVSFRAFRRPFLVMVTLAAGVTVVLAGAVVYPGHLTLLSAFVASILFGLGVDFGIHIVDRLEEILAEGKLTEREAVVEAVASLSGALATTGLTTASVFLAMLVSGFLGFAELGAIAGAGVMVCLVAMCSVLPALLAVFSPARPQTREQSHRRLGTLLVLLQHKSLAWGVGAIALAGALVGPPSFDSDYLNLQPSASEAVRLEREMVRRSGYSPQFAAFILDSLDDVRALSVTLLDEEVVGEVHSVADFGMLSPFGSAVPVPADVLEHFRSDDGRYAVYAYPAADIWEPAARDEFLERMKAIDPGVTGLPILGRFMVDRSQRAVAITGSVGGLLLLVIVWLDFRSWRLTCAALLPTLLTATSLGAVMQIVGLDLNPLSIMALPVVLGVAVDDGVHVVHRFVAEAGDLHRTIAGTGRSVVLTSLTTMAAFGSLTVASHRGLASFASALTLGVGLALVFSVLVLPAVLERLFRGRSAKGRFAVRAQGQTGRDV